MKYSAMTEPYSEAFCTDDSVQRYNEVVYQPGAYHDFIWSLQRDKLRELVDRAKRNCPSLRYLDFACGTGRILSALEGIAATSTGVDISPNMAAVAVKRTTRSKIVVGDILQNPDLIDGAFDLITAFRFFLNAEPDLRIRVMRALAKRLRTPNSILIFSVHGNRTSLRHLAIWYRARRSGVRHSELAIGEVRELISRAGLELANWRGFGICPEFTYGGKVGWLARLVDRVSSKLPLLKWVSYDLLFVCRPAAAEVSQSTDSQFG
jgi:SAM-dependent methyltransferase